MSLLQALKLTPPAGLAGGAPPVSPAEAAWNSRAAAFDAAAQQVATIEKAGDPRGAVLRQVIDRIAEQAERRQFEAQMKMLSTAESNEKAAAQLLSVG